MNKLKENRILRSLTQAELSESSGISIRTIQRIEKGLSTGSPHTLKSLAKTLDIEITDILAVGENLNSANEDDFSKVKLLNFSVLSGLLIPFGNIIFPTIIFLRNKANRKTNKISRKIISFQIIITSILFFLTFLMFEIIGRGSGAIPLPVFISYIIYVLVSGFAVISTSIDIDRKNEVLTFCPNII